MLFWKRFSKFLMYLFFIAYLAYFYFIWFDELKNKIIKAVKPNISSEKVVEWLKEKFKNIKNNLYKKDDNNFIEY
jgi:ATP-dependent Lon protease